MKKLLCFLLTCSFLLLIPACSSEPVSFTSDLSAGKECYVDVTKITPLTYINDVDFLYCKCTLADGSTIHMEIFADDYIYYFDSEADKENINVTAHTITYNNTVRLNGRVYKIKDIINNGNEEIKVFRFSFADKTATHAIGTKASSAVSYTNRLKNNTLIYADIVRVEPQYTITTYLTVDHVLCACQTIDDYSFMMYISTDDYHDYWDSSAYFDNWDPVNNNSNADVLEFIDPVRVSGITISRSEIKTTDSNSLPEQLVEFKAVNKEQVEAAMLTNQEPVLFTETATVNQPVYVDIKSITPQYGLTSLYASLAESLICECTTTDNEKVWIAIKTGNYVNSFFDDYADNMQVEKQLDQPVRLTGLVDDTNNIAVNLYDKISVDKIIVFSEVSPIS